MAAIFPSLAGLVSLSFQALSPEALAAQTDAVFLALPHTKSLAPVSACLQIGKLVVDLSADYRLKDPAVYERWYHTPHTYSDLLKDAVYGLPELHRAAIAKARLVASPGCYPTAAVLQLAPLFAQDLVQPHTVVIDAKSGISGWRMTLPGLHAQSGLPFYAITAAIRTEGRCLCSADSRRRTSFPDNALRA